MIERKPTSTWAKADPTEWTKEECDIICDYEGRLPFNRRLWEYVRDNLLHNRQAAGRGWHYMESPLDDRNKGKKELKCEKCGYTFPWKDRLLMSVRPCAVLQPAAWRPPHGRPPDGGEFTGPDAEEVWIPYEFTPGVRTNRADDAYMLKGRKYKYGNPGKAVVPSKVVGLEDAQSLGLPSGWKMKVSTKKKLFYNPEGKLFPLYQDACAAAGVSPMERCELLARTNKEKKYVRKVQLKRRKP